MELESIFMIRAGAFGTDFTTKFMMSAVAIAMALWDRYRHGRYDVGIALLFGTAVWTSAEFFLQRSEARELAQATLFGFGIPSWVHLPIQGCSEGGAMAAYAVHFGDRLLHPKSRRRAAMVFAGFLVVIMSKGFAVSAVHPSENVITSVRAMFTPASMLYVGSMTLLSVVFFRRAKPFQRRRGVAMFAVLIGICSAFTFSQFMEEGRWVTIGAEDLYSMPPWPIELLLLAYDIIAEFGAVVFAFFVIPAALGWMTTRLPVIEGHVEGHPEGESCELPNHHHHD